MKKREVRHKTCLAAEMRLDGGWVGVQILNISTRGMLVQCRTNPVRGDYVEITRGAQRVIGRIAWSKGGKFGLRTQDRIEIDAFIEHPDAAKSCDGTAACLDRPLEAPEHRLARSQRVSTIMQFGILAVGGIAAATFLADSVHDLLAASLAPVAQALSGKG